MAASSRMSTSRPLEAFQRRRISRTPRPGAACLAEVRMTYHRAWRDLVKDLESGDQEGMSGANLDDEGR